MSKEHITQLSIKNLLGGKDNYIIPMYQRNYAWEEGEITQLIQDIIDSKPQNKPYYIGTLVVRELDGNHQAPLYETIDGQQRLTTLSLLASYLKNESKGDDQFDWYNELKIQFESREKSSKTFAAIFNHHFSHEPEELLKEDEVNASLLNGYRLIKKILPNKIKENAEKVDWHSFCDYLFNQVLLMRVAVPDDTDLNHYFEIMNNRGEQLEKHEILKSKMLEVLSNIQKKTDREQSQNCLHAIWEAASNMEKYAQMGFTPAVRESVFGAGDWGKFECSNFEELCNIEGLGKISKKARSTRLSLLEIIESGNHPPIIDNEDDESPDRFNTVINFPNFLLHVLRVTTEEDIPLDDKRLIDTFETHLLKQSDPINKVKSFAYNLLKLKYLYDQYIIKREFSKGSDRWSLKRLKKNKKTKSGYYVNSFGDNDEDVESSTNSHNREVLMLLAAFHVSTPTLVYKHWLNAALSYLFRAQNITAESYRNHLESVATSFIFDRFLVTDEQELNYFEMIYGNESLCQSQRTDFTDDDVALKLSFGGIENNLIFNYLDYLLWKKEWDNKNPVDSKIRAFEFTFRSSVEHYYPQTPMEGYDSLNEEDLNSFGNLCLISHSKNSRLSNFMPTAKKDYYKKNDIDSIKQHLMMKEYPEWNVESIQKHYILMKDTLLNCLAD